MHKTPEKLSAWWFCIITVRFNNLLSWELCVFRTIYPEMLLFFFFFFIFPKNTLLIKIHPSLFTHIFNPGFSLFSLRLRDWFITLALVSSVFLLSYQHILCKTILKQLLRCMRKMSAQILILKCKATEMPSEWFRNMKCNENIFV